MPALDLIIVGAYLGGVLWLSARLAKSNTSTEDHYVGGRSLPWWALGLSTMATQSSANSFIGIPAFVALVPGGGLVWLQYELAVPLALAIVMTVFVPVFRGLGLVSIYEYLEIRFDRPTRLLLSGVFLLSRALAAGVALYAAAVVVEVSTGLSLTVCVLMMGFVTVIYDLLGGMRAVVWTDVLQMAMMVVGIAICGTLGWREAGGWSGLIAHIDPGRVAAIQWAHGLGDRARAPLWGFVIGGLVLYVAYYGVDQSQVQRQLSAASVGDARRLLAFNALARFPLTLLYAGLGLILAAVYARNEALRDAVPAHRLDLLVPHFISMMLPSGARGLLVAAVLAAAMSSLDSALNSLSASTLRDFLARRVDERHQMRAARLVTLAWGMVITAIGLNAGQFGSSVIEGINRVGAVFYGPLLAAFGCGILDRRATGAAIRAAVAAGLGVNLLLILAFGPALFWMWWNVSGLVVAVASCWLLCRLMPRSSDWPVEVTGLGWQSQKSIDLPHAKWALILLLVTIAMVAVMLGLNIVSGTMATVAGVAAN